MTFVQRFGGSLNLNVHLHLVSTDGVFVLDGKNGVRFVPLPEPTTAEVERVVERARKSILRWLRRNGHLDDGDDAAPDEPPDGFEACQRLALPYGTLVALSGAAAGDDRQARFEPNRRHRWPTYSSWLNLVERLFALLTERALKRGVHRSTVALEKAIREFVDAHNVEPKPFVWTKSADAILASVSRFCTKTLNEQGIA